MGKSYVVWEKRARSNVVPNKAIFSHSCSFYDPRSIVCGVRQMLVSLLRLDLALKFNICKEIVAKWRMAKIISIERELFFLSWSPYQCYDHNMGPCGWWGLKLYKIKYFRHNYERGNLVSFLFSSVAWILHVSQCVRTRLWYLSLNRMYTCLFTQGLIGFTIHTLCWCVASFFRGWLRMAWIYHFQLILWLHEL